MEAILTPLISQLKNPWQYICVGLIWSSILYFGIDKQYLIPFIIASLGIAYLIEQIYTKIIRTIFQKIKNYFVSKKILKTLKNCSSEEKDFLYNRVYENNNELQIDMDRDTYFYEKKLISRYGGGFTYELYKGNFDDKEKVIKFLR